MSRLMSHLGKFRNAYLGEARANCKYARLKQNEVIKYSFETWRLSAHHRHSYIKQPGMNIYFIFIPKHT
jgi:hypothetical protein